ncbi:MAG TPA: hypothetical protein ENJ56_08250 [Anaerolineae bacterium]|nr:hypothetical protein [Anaerolineae bacterium]
MIDVNFFDDPLKAPRSREDVRFKQLGIYVHEGNRRIAVGFDITPFIERPSIEVTVRNVLGEPAGNLTVIETLDSNFNLTMHLRDKVPTDQYEVSATLYYVAPESERVNVHTLTGTIDVSVAGKQFSITE